MINMSKISGCDVTQCSYNRNNQCHTPAITVGDPGGCAMCDTFVQTEVRGGSMDVSGGVGACKSYDCQFNNDLECTAGEIRVGMHKSHPDCMTFQPR